MIVIGSIIISLCLTRNIFSYCPLKVTVYPGGRVIDSFTRSLAFVT
ncbi:MAG: hypothetical protein BWY47_00871 [Bacteroidetes bacterium ADurb.Bin302]|nr:MAG: hypothetical protein BWY47_00871 [Bacteroidetes bacterium ADurb.Bin302]